MSRKYADATLKYGDRVVVTIDDVVATGMFVAGIGGQRYEVVLDGTEQMVVVPGAYLTREESP